MDPIREVQRELDAHPTWRTAYDVGVVPAAEARCLACAAATERTAVVVVVVVVTDAGDPR